LIVHVPAARNVAAVPETVQTVCVAEAKLTARPEVAVPVSVNGVPTVCVAGVAKVIVCAVSAAALTAKLRVTGVAAAKVELPVCVALIVHVPVARKVAVVPVTVQIVCVVEEKLIARPEVEVAVSVSGVPTVCVAGVAKVIVCAVSAAALTAKLLETGVAAA